MGLLTGQNTTKYSQYTADQFTGNGSQTIYTLTRTPPTSSSIIVTIDGVKQHISTYTVTGNGTLTFSEAPPSGSAIEIVHINSQGIAFTPSDASVSTPKIIDLAVTTAKIADGNVTPSKYDVNGTGTGAVLLPSGTSAQRPASPVDGQIRFNTTSGFPEVYNQGSWNSFAQVANGLSSSTPYTKYSDMAANPGTSGTYWIKTSNMTSAQQFYVDFSTSFGPWVRIFLSSTDNYNQTSFSWDNATAPTMIGDSQYFMYAFVNTSTNGLTYPWAFKFYNQSGVSFSTTTDGNYAAFRDYPPMAHGGIGSPLITLVRTVRLADNSQYTGYLRTGSSSFGSLCDDSRSGTWGMICLKAGGTGGSGIGSGGYSDFPMFTTFSNAGTDNWAASNQNYTTNTVSSSYRFGIYVKLA